MLDPVSTGATALAAGALTSGPAMRGMTKAATAMSGKGLYDTLSPDLQKLIDQLDPATANYVLSNLGARTATNEGQR